MEIAYIGLGSNIGERERYLYTALKEMDTDAAIQIIDLSSIYETEPVGVTSQPVFLNMVAEIKTTYTPYELLDCLQEIEGQCKRTRELKWGPRTLDLDILLYNQENMKSERLEIPHPRMKERGFVLIPLFEVNPQLVKNELYEEYKSVLKPSQCAVKVWQKKNEVLKHLR